MQAKRMPLDRMKRRVPSRSENMSRRSNEWTRQRPWNSVVQCLMMSEVQAET
jgi:ElaB/YqjD/DUF883 family membrane-anchored ribosome-binding protein